MNTPYIKQIEQLGTRSFIDKNGNLIVRQNTRVLNPISVDTPYIQKGSGPNKRADKYLQLSDGSRIKNKGNNRKNSSKRANKHSRLYQRFVGI